MWEPAISGMGNAHNCVPKLQAYPPIFSRTPKASGSMWLQSCEVHKELTGSGRSELYTDLIKLIVKISDYIFQDEEKIQKGIGDAMGGKVLELESERLRAEGEARGKAIGESIGEARGKAIGESIGKAIGEVRGEERLSVLINKLILDKRNDEIQIVVTDAKKRRQYYDEYGL